MVNMEIMSSRQNAWTHGSLLQGTMSPIEHPIADTDLPGFRSHVRYSIFKERRQLGPPLA